MNAAFLDWQIMKLAFLEPHYQVDKNYESGVSGLTNYESGLSGLANYESDVSGLVNYEWPLWIGKL